jgi:hypothetical protein
MYRQGRDRNVKPKSSTVLVRVIFVFVIAVIAYLLAGLVIDRFDLYQVIRSNPVDIPLINVSSSEIPEWLLRIVLTLIIFFLLQPLLVIILDLINPEKEEPIETGYPDSWSR